MFRRYITRAVIIRIMLVLQVAPLLAMPISTYSLNTQEWWLPAFLSLLTLISLIKILPRRSLSTWPWYLLAFSQGFNIISRLMMLLPHATKYVEGSGMTANGPYIVISMSAMIFSAVELLYCELPEVRLRMAPKFVVKAA
jgi:hypothetical protein